MLSGSAAARASDGRAFEPVYRGCDVGDAQEGFRALVVSGGDCPVDLELADQHIICLAVCRLAARQVAGDR